MTKVLPVADFRRFVEAAGLVDISDRLDQRQSEELIPEDLVFPEWDQSE